MQAPDYQLKKWMLWAALSVILLVFVLTNPTKSEYADWLSAEAHQEISKEDDSIAFLLSLIPIEKIVSRCTIHRNFILFSVFHTKVEGVGEVKAAGFLKQIIPFYVCTSSGKDRSRKELEKSPAKPTLKSDPPYHSPLYDPPVLEELMKDPPSEVPRVIPFETVLFRNGTCLPVEAIKARYGLPSHPPVLPDSFLGTIDFDLPPSQAERLAVYCINNGTIFLAPRGWEVLRADVGADGSTGIFLRSPDSAEWMYLTHNGACQGCAVDDLAQWIPGWLAEGQKRHEIVTQPRPFRYPVRFVRLGEHSVAFSYQPPGSHTVHGVSYYKDGPERLFFSQAFVALREQDRPLATTILNFYLNVTAPRWCPHRD
ncbi:DUF4850 domain-containing protein [Desulfothermobacter acidiphilus]|uniref:DUF4850 domain-containing protein n=1 Tax=Desulfothermobacter acidiphilus TaxID=1938353 RepID=UPI003F88A567